MKYSHYQKAIFQAVEEGKDNILVSACAGSGKTTTLIQCLNIVPSTDSVLFVAFNKHIVEELRGRMPPHVSALTCHAMGFAAIKTHLKRGMYVNAKKYRDIAAGVIKEKVRTKNKEEAYKLAGQLYELCEIARLYCDESMFSIDSVILSNGMDIDPRVMPLYEECLKEGNDIAMKLGQVDFMDMLYLPFKWSCEFPRYDWVFVDELQDLNALQHYMLSQSLKKEGIIMGVGDRKQSMYGFSGALPNSMDEFKNKFNCIELPLSICYRCPVSHLEIARALDGNRTEPRYGKEEGKVGFITLDKLHEYVKPGDMVGCRLTAPLIGACIQLIAKKKNAKVLGRNIGYQLTSVLKEAFPKEKTNLFHSEFGDTMRMYLVDYIAKWKDKSGGDYKIQLLKDKVEAINACYSSGKFDIGSLDNFCKSIQEIFSDKESQITLCTHHRQKGLQAERVFIIIDREGKKVMPLTWKGQQLWELDQENNIEYVALTRAKQELYFVCGSEITVREMQATYQAMQAKGKWVETRAEEPKEKTVKKLKKKKEVLEITFEE